MRTFLAGFCAPGGPLAKAVGIFLEKQPLPPWGPRPPLGNFKKLPLSLKILSLGMRTFLAGFCAPGGPLAKAIGIFLEKQPLPGDHDPPLGISKSYPCLKILSLGMRTFLASFCAARGPLAKAVGIFLEKQPLPGDHDPPLGISKSYLSKNLQHGDANISGGFLRSWRSLWQKP